MGIGSKVSERDIEFIAKGVHEAWQQETYQTGLEIRRNNRQGSQTQ